MARHLGAMDQPALRGAAAAIHCGRLDLAEAAYQRMGRGDLALDMHAHHGDWHAVQALSCSAAPGRLSRVKGLA